MTWLSHWSGWTASRTITAHVHWSWARSHEMVSQSRFHRRRSTAWGPASADRSFLIVLAHVFSCPPTHFRQLGREVGRSTWWMSSSSGRRAAWMYNECHSLSSRHKITLDRFICIKINQSWWQNLICFYITIWLWFQVFRVNTNNFQTNQFDLQMGL